MRKIRAIHKVRDGNLKGIKGQPRMISSYYARVPLDPSADPNIRLTICSSTWFAPKIVHSCARSSFLAEEIDKPSRETTSWIDFRCSSSLFRSEIDTSASNTRRCMLPESTVIASVKVRVTTCLVAASEGPELQR